MGRVIDKDISITDCWDRPAASISALPAGCTPYIGKVTAPGARYCGGPSKTLIPATIFESDADSEDDS